MLHIMTCEDDVEDARQLARALGSCHILHDVDYQVESFRTARQLLLNYEAAHCDILFLDILIGDGDGISVARKIRDLNADVPIVFVTSSRDYAIDSYDVNAVHYLMKPVTPQAVDEALKRCQRVIHDKHRTIKVMSGRMTERVLARDVMYAETFGHRVTLHLRGRDLDTTTPLAKIAEEGGDPFLRCHRSFVVNMDYVTAVHGKSFMMADGSEVPIRTNGSAQVIAAYHAYLFASVRKL